MHSFHEKCSSTCDQCGQPGKDQIWMGDYTEVIGFCLDCLGVDSYQEWLKKSESFDNFDDIYDDMEAAGFCEHCFYGGNYHHPQCPDLYFGSVAFKYDGTQQLWDLSEYGLLISIG